MHSEHNSGSQSEAYLTPTPIIPEHHNLYFKDFDSAAEDQEPNSNSSEEEDFDIPYDRTYRPLSTLDFDHLLPDLRPLNVLDPDDDDEQESVAGSPPRGRTRERQLHAERTAYVPASPIRSQDTQEAPKKLPKAKVSTAKPIHFSKPLPASKPAPPPSVEPTASKMSRQTETSSSGSSVFDEPTFDNPDEHYTDPTDLTSRGASADEDKVGYDLKPPPPSHQLENIEYLSERLFSSDHLKLILRDPAMNSRFNTFLQKYRPDSQRALEQYLKVQKAISAVDYANAIAEALGGTGTAAAHQDEDFEEVTRKSVDELVDHALPGFVTHRLVQIVTEVLVKEITGQNTPIMRELVNGLAEVYCLTDPALPDNPIVYASEEFYRCTQYGKNYVIGRNCRFLQGPKSSNSSVQRLVDALSEGQEICETILNYRRDGSPFMNLLMIAPLYDNKGSVRYFIGAQIDVNGLIEGGRGLDSFEKLLREDRSHDRYGGRAMGKTPEQALGELAGLMDDDDLESVASRGTKTKAQGSTAGGSGASTPVRRNNKPANARRFVGMDDPTDKGLWPAPSLGPSGRLPGVFQNYLLIRPYPSLRITFTSPALRIPGLLQSKFLDRIGGPARIRDQILDALSSGVGVTAKITWLPHAQSSTDKDSHNTGGSYRENDSEGRQRWIHCTPLLGSDEKVGVWMVVMVENETVTGGLNRERGHNAQNTYDPDSSRHPHRHRPGYDGTANDGRDSIQRARDAKASSPQSPAAYHRQPSNYTNNNNNNNNNTTRQRRPSYASNSTNPPTAPPPDIPRGRQGQDRSTQNQNQNQNRNQSPQQPQPQPQLQPSEQQQQQQQQQNTYRSGYGSPKTFPHELKPITSAYGGRSASAAGEKVGVRGMPGGGNGGGGDREARARRLAERATAGEESFRDF